MALSDKLQKLVDAAGAAVDSIKLNGVSRGQRGGRPLRVKRRRKGSEQIAGLANVFFQLADAPISVLANPSEWQRWEIRCFRMLNGDELTAFVQGPRTLCAA